MKDHLISYTDAVPMIQTCCCINYGRSNSGRPIGKTRMFSSVCNGVTVTWKRLQSLVVIHGFEAGLLMRLEHRKTKAKTETRECETEIETETETSPVKSIARESNTDRYVLFFITHMR